MDFLIARFRRGDCGRHLFPAGMAILLMLCCVSPALSASVTVSPVGFGYYIIQGDGMSAVAGVELNVRYDSTIMASPTISQGSLVSGAMMTVDTSRAEEIKITIISMKPFPSSGQIAQISFAFLKGTGGITSVSAAMIDRNGEPVEAQAYVSGGQEPTAGSRIAASPRVRELEPSPPPPAKVEPPPAPTRTAQPAEPATPPIVVSKAPETPPVSKQPEPKAKTATVETKKPSGPVPPSPEVLRFDISRYEVEGNTLLEVGKVEDILASKTGKNRDFGTVQQAVDALEQAYRSKGFNAVRVILPEQELRDGVVRLKVIETRIGTVAIEGNQYFSSDNIRRSVPELEAGITPNIGHISSEIRVANENPAKKVQLVLQRGAREDVMNALLKVSDEKFWKVGTFLDDTGTPETGSLRLGFMAQYANLFNLDHLLTFQYITSPDHLKDVNIYSAGYRIPLYSWGDSIDLYGGYSDVNSGSVQSGALSLDISGKGSFAGLRYNQNLARRGAYEHRLMYSFDYRRFENNINFMGIPLGTVTEAHPLSIGYSGSYSFSAGHEASFWLSLAQNIPGGDKGNEFDYQQVRADAAGDFTILRGGGNVRTLLPDDWQARFVFDGQYSAVPLIPGEQFGAGGQNSLRGFDERELADDIGVAASLECYTPDIMKLLKVDRSQLRALAFYDLTFLERNKPQPGEQKNRAASSAGLGLRLAIDRYFTASTDYAFVLEPEGRHSRGDGRWHFRVQLNY